MKNEDREIWVGETRLYLGEDNIIYISVIGEVDEKTSMAMKEIFDKFTAMVEGKVNILTDLNKSGKPSPGARRAALEGFASERINKTAFFGLHPVARVIASFVIGRSKNKNMRFFKTKEEALAWLKE